MKKFHIILIALLYVSQSLPLGFVFLALPTILRSDGMSLEHISYFYAIGLLWVIKFLWAPAVDRFSFGRFGHYKVWLLGMQMLLVISSLYISMIEEVNEHFLTLLIAATLLAFFSSTQDIAIDAITCRLCPKDKPGIGSALQMFGGLLGMMLGGGVVLVVYKHIGWDVCLYIIAVCLLITSLVAVFFNEKDIALSNEGIEINQAKFSRSFTFWKGSEMWVWALILCSVPVSITITWSLVGPMLIDQKWETDEVGLLIHIIAPLLGILITPLCGWLVNTFGKWRVLLAIPSLQFFGLILFLRVADGSASLLSTQITLLIVYCLDVSLYGILMAFMLGYSEKGTEGSDFTVQTSVYGLVAFSVGGISLNFAETVGYLQIVQIAIAVNISSAVLLYSLWFFKVKSKQSISAN